MKKSIFNLCLIITFFIHPAHAQGIYQFWGVMGNGGSQSNGTIYTTKNDGSSIAVQKNFTVTNPGDPMEFGRPVVYNSKLYCLMHDGGYDNAGIITEYDPQTDVWVKKADLFSIAGKQPQGNLLVYNNKLYGTCRGGIAEEGMIFEFDPVSSNLIALFDFSNGIGSAPTSGLTLYNNKFYGVTIYEGVNGDGVIYEFNPANNAYSKKADFLEATTGINYLGGLTVYNNLLYGVTNWGATANCGALFSFNPANNALQIKANLSDENMKRHYGPVTVLNNKIYGFAEPPQLNDPACIFEYDPAGNTLTKKLTLQPGQAEQGLTLTVYNNKLYGASITGGTNGVGQLFSYDPVPNSYTPLLNMNNVSGSNPRQALVVYNNRLWGFTNNGGLYAKGNLYSVNPAAPVFTPELQLGGPEFIKPMGQMVYYNYKLYGMAAYGGSTLNIGNSGGGIFEYNVASGVFTELVSLQNNTQGSFAGNNTLKLHNNKMYGVTANGGANGDGTLFYFNPQNNSFTVLHHFVQATGKHPVASPVVYNGKLYGTCTEGSTNNAGNIYEYDLNTNAYSQKVVLGGNFGGDCYGGLTLYNSKLYGLCNSAGLNNYGTLFEYTPLGNAFQVKVQMDGTQGFSFGNGLTLYNNKMYSCSAYGFANNLGGIFEYIPGNNFITNKAEFTPATGDGSTTDFTVFNNKLYAHCLYGGAGKGLIYQFDPATNAITTKANLSAITGYQPYNSSLKAIPALTAPGNDNFCTISQTIIINATNANQWIQFTDGEGRAVAEINANGNILDSTTVNFYINANAVRQDGNGDFYLDRNFTIHAANQPGSPVSIRLYIRKAEYNALAATPGSNIADPSDLSIFRNADVCAASLTGPKVQLSTIQGPWGTEYVYITNTDSLASFYLGGAGNVPLPIDLLSFEGKKEIESNRLTWKANCIHPSLFVLERSADGISFSEIHKVNAQVTDCDFPFVYKDASSMQGKSYYRLQMQDEDGLKKYSQVICLDRSSGADFKLSIAPNPVTNALMHIQIFSSESSNASLQIADMNGKIVWYQNAPVSKGAQQLSFDVRSLSSGIYVLLYNDGVRTQQVSFRVE